MPITLSREFLHIPALLRQNGFDVDRSTFRRLQRTVPEAFLENTDVIAGERGLSAIANTFMRDEAERSLVRESLRTSRRVASEDEIDPVQKKVLIRFTQGKLRYFDVAGREIAIMLHRNVHPPDFISRKIAAHLIGRTGAGDSVVDMGTGSGFLAIAAAVSEKPARVTGTDLNRDALYLAMHNARMNGLSGIDFIFGDMFNPFKRKHDIIVFNPPVMISPPGAEKPDDMPGINLAREGGPDGRMVLDTFIQGVPARLNPGGRTIFYQYDYLDIEKTMLMMRNSGLVPEVLEIMNMKLSLENSLFYEVSRRGLIESVSGRPFLEEDGNLIFQIFILMGTLRS